MSVYLGRRLHFVPRWTIVPTLRRQNVAEHTFGVARIVLWLLKLHESGHEPEFRLSALEHALEHDDEEAITGDRPSSSKTRKTVSGEDQIEVIVKVADCLEALVFLHEEKAMGNNYGIDALMMDVRLSLHDWWGFFEHRRDVKMRITSDLIRDLMSEAVPVDGCNISHPGMDPRYR